MDTVEVKFPSMVGIEEDNRIYLEIDSLTGALATVADQLRTLGEDRAAVTYEYLRRYLTEVGEKTKWTPLVSDLSKRDG